MNSELDRVINNRQKNGKNDIQEETKFNKLSGLHRLHGAWESAHYKVVEPGVSKT